MVRLGAGASSQIVSFTLRPAALISVQSEPKGATVTYGGREIGKTPLKLRLVAGEHLVKLSMPGRHPAARFVVAKAGKEVTVRVALSLTEEEKKRLVLIGNRWKAQVETEDVEVSRTPDTPLHRKRRLKTILAYSTLAGGLALAAVGGILYGIGSSQGGEAHDKYVAAADTAPPVDVTELDQHRSDIEAARTKMTAASVLMGVSAAALGFSIYQFVTRPSAEASPSEKDLRTAVRLAPSVTGVSISLTGSF